MVRALDVVLAGMEVGGSVTRVRLVDIIEGKTRLVVTVELAEVRASNMETELVTACDVVVAVVCASLVVAFCSDVVGAMVVCA